MAIGPLRGLAATAVPDFAAKLRAIVGAANVVFEEEGLAPYSRMLVPGDAAACRPAGVVLPGSTAEVQKILALCSAAGVPVWPVSTGNNFGYGSRCPASAGQLVLDLGRMNRILDVDAELCTALVEPGVTYHQLYNYINDKELPLWLAVPGPGPLVGPVGQGLERGQGYTALGEQFESICGMEVVLADGSVLRTGMGGVADTTSWQSYKYGYGPHLDGLFTQSNFGVVTKLGIWLTPRPKNIKIFGAIFDRLEDIDKLVDAARILKVNRTVDSPILTGFLASYQMLYGHRDKVTKGGPLTREDYLKFLDKEGDPPLTAVGNVTGSDGEVAAKYDEVKRVFGQYGAKVIDDLLLQTVPLYKHLTHAMTGTPDTFELNLMNWVPGGGMVWFAPVCPARGRDARLQVDLGWSIMQRHGFDYDGGFFINGRSALHVIAIMFDKTDPAADARAQACYADLLASFAAKGFGVYRTNTVFMDKAADTFGSAQRLINRKIKLALDPKNIIAPGKSGISVDA